MCCAWYSLTRSTLEADLLYLYCSRSCRLVARLLTPIMDMKQKHDIDHIFLIHDMYTIFNILSNI